MIKAIIDNKILLGLDKENIKRLVEGAPIFIKGKQLGINYDIYLVYGITLKDIQVDLGLPNHNIPPPPLTRA